MKKITALLMVITMLTSLLSIVNAQDTAELFAISQAAMSAEITEAVKGVGNYTVKATIKNNQSSSNSVRAITVLKTETKKAKAVESQNLTVAANGSMDIESVITLSDNVTYAEVYVVKNYSTAQVMSNKAVSIIDDGRQWTDWSDSLPSDITETNYYIEEKLQYTKRTKSIKTSSNIENGWTLVSEAWNSSPSSSSSFDYASFPGGFSTSHSLYSGYNKSVPSSSEGSTSKTVISTAFSGRYIYWHWCRGRTGINGPLNSQIRRAYDSEYCAFHAFESSTYVSWNSSSDACQYSNASACVDSYWWNEPISINTCTSKVYNKVYTISRWGEWSAWQDTALTAGTNEEVDTKNVYRYKSKAEKAPEDTTGTVRPISGSNISMANTYANIIVYKTNAISDANIVAIEQVEVAVNGNYSANVLLSEEPTKASGDFNVVLCSTNGSYVALDSIGLKKVDSVSANPNPNDSNGIIAKDGTVTLSTETQGATIYYTLDGSIPNTSSNLYNKPIVISENTTITAYAVCDDMYDSDVSTFTYSTDENAPKIIVDNVETQSGQNVSVNIMLANNPGIAGFTTKLSFDNTKLTYVSSAASDLLDGGTFRSSITTDANHQDISYVRSAWGTTDNMTGNGTIYTVIFAIDSSVTSGTVIPLTLSYEDGDIANADLDDVSLFISSGKITIENEATTSVSGITLSSSSENIIVGNTFEIIANITPVDASNRNVTWSSSDTNVATVTNGVVSAISSGSCVITATTVDGGYTADCRITVSEPITVTATAPIASIASGTVQSGTTVTLSTMTENANIYYTLDGQIPTQTSTKYIAPITITANTTLKAISICEGMNDSTVTTYVYTLASENAPTISIKSDSSKVKPGGEISLTLELTNNTGFANIAVELGYDTNVFTLKNVANGTSVGGSFTKSQNISTVPYILSWNSTENNIYNGTIATLTFDVAENVTEGNYNFTVDYYKGVSGNYVDGVSVNYDEDYAALGLCYVGKSIEIKNYTPGDIYPDNNVDNRDGTALLRYLAGWSTETNQVNEDALDTNGDEYVDNKDGTHLLRYLAGWDVTLH